MKPRFEYLYDNIKDITHIYVWKGQQIIQSNEMPGKLSSYQKTKIKKEIIKRIKED